MDRGLITRAVGPGSGIFRAIHRSEAPESGAFCLSREVQAKRGACYDNDPDHQYERCGGAQCRGCSPPLPGPAACL